MIIDAHQHFWQLDRGDYDWLTPALPSLYRDFMPDDLAPHLRGHDVIGTVLVQAAPTEDETRFLLDIAKSTPTVLGVVGWIDMEADNAVERLDALMAYGEGYLKGIRPMIQDIADPEWLLMTRLDRVFQAMVERELVFDALVRPMHLANLERRLRQHPQLKTVIDHGAKPMISSHARSAWSDAMRSLANHTDAVCKLSGLVTEASADWTASDIRPYVAELIYHFGPKRLIWGSDWPVVNLAADYAGWLSVAQMCCGRLDKRDREMIFGRNARVIYGLDALCRL